MIKYFCFYFTLYSLPSNSAALMEKIAEDTNRRAFYAKGDIMNDAFAYSFSYDRRLAEVFLLGVKKKEVLAEELNEMPDLLREEIGDGAAIAFGQASYYFRERRKYSALLGSVAGGAAALFVYFDYYPAVTCIAGGFSVISVIVAAVNHARHKALEKLWMESWLPKWSLLSVEERQPLREALRAKRAERFRAER